MPNRSVRLRFLGGPTIETGTDKTAEGLIAQPKRLAFLAYLAVSEALSHPREKLLALFWPESDSGHARSSLRQAIHFIRSTLGSNVLVSVGVDLALKRELIWCDVIELERLLTAGDAAGALALYRGDFLEGLYVHGAPDFEHWIETQRARLRNIADHSCLKAAEEELAKSNLQGALFWANRGELINPTNEQLLRMTIELSEKLGDRVGAIAKYDEYAAWLRKQHGLEPAPETVSLVQQVKSRRREGLRVERRLSPTEDMKAILTFHTPPAPRRSLDSRRRTPARPASIGPGTLASRDFLEGAFDITYTTDQYGILQSVNAPVTQILGYTPAELRGRQLIDFILPEFRRPMSKLYARQVKEKIPTTYHELPVRTLSGKTIWLGQIIHVVEKDGGEIQIHGIARDITDRRNAETTESRLAWRDSVTGLYNRDAFVVLAEHRRALAAETGLPFEFLAISAVNLSQLAQERGNTIADRAVVLVAQALQETFRRSDIIARVARNRFVVMPSDWSGQGLAGPSSRLKGRISENADRHLGFSLPISIIRLSDIGAATGGGPDVLAAGAA